MVESKIARMTRVIAALRKNYPDAHCSLDYKTPFQLLVATVLSAQCTDARVNRVTPVLFNRFKTCNALADAPLEEIEEVIRSTGFFRSKAKALKELSNELVIRYGSEVPRKLSELTTLRGVGRKTANVVLGNAMGIPGFVVDTHVGRLCRRMGFTRQNDPVKVEMEMEKLVPKEYWTVFSHWLIAHGRAICVARSPRCLECFLKTECQQIGVPK